MTAPVCALLFGLVLVNAQDMVTTAPQRKLSKPRSGTVSLFELEHAVNGKASKQADEAEKKYANDHDLNAYVRRMQKTVALDPDFVKARLNLAVAYLKTGHPADVVGEANEVLNRDRNSALAYSLISAADLEMHEYAAAEAAARRALQIDSSDAVSRYHLGMSLQLQQKDDREALQLLGAVAPQFPKAHVFEAEILEREGQKSAAKSHLETYLSSGDQELNEQVKSWLWSLR